MTVVKAKRSVREELQVESSSLSIFWKLLTPFILISLFFSGAVFLNVQLNKLEAQGQHLTKEILEKKQYLDALEAEINKLLIGRDVVN